MHVISTLGANVKPTIYFIVYASRWKTRDMCVMLHKISYFCLRLQWNVCEGEGTEGEVGYP